MPEPTARASYLTRQHYRKLFFREKTVIYLAHNIPLQTIKKNTLKYNILIIIKFTMQHYIFIVTPGHVDSNLQRESILREINLYKIYKNYAGKYKPQVKSLRDIV